MTNVLIPCLKLKQSFNPDRDDDCPLHLIPGIEELKHAETQKLREALNVQCVILRRNFDDIFEEEGNNKLMKTTKRLRKKLSKEVVESDYFDPRSHSQSMRLLQSCIRNQTDHKSFRKRSRILKVIKDIIEYSD